MAGQRNLGMRRTFCCVQCAEFGELEWCCWRRCSLRLCPGVLRLLSRVATVCWRWRHGTAGAWSWSAPTAAARGASARTCALGGAAALVTGRPRDCVRQPGHPDRLHRRFVYELHVRCRAEPGVFAVGDGDLVRVRSFDTARRDRRHSSATAAARQCVGWGVGREWLDCDRAQRGDLGGFAAQASRPARRAQADRFGERAIVVTGQPLAGGHRRWLDRRCECKDPPRASAGTRRRALVFTRRPVDRVHRRAPPATGGQRGRPPSAAATGREAHGRVGRLAATTDHRQPGCAAPSGSVALASSRDAEVTSDGVGEPERLHVRPEGLNGLPARRWSRALPRASGSGDKDDGVSSISTAAVSAPYTALVASYWENHYQVGPMTCRCSICAGCASRSSSAARAWYATTSHLATAGSIRSCSAATGCLPCTRACSGQINDSRAARHGGADRGFRQLGRADPRPGHDHLRIVPHRADTERRHSLLEPRPDADEHDALAAMSNTDPLTLGPPRRSIRWSRGGGFEWLCVRTVVSWRRSPQLSRGC